MFEFETVIKLMHRYSILSWVSLFNLILYSVMDSINGAFNCLFKVNETVQVSISSTRNELKEKTRSVF